jgi:hypothetical protein
MMIGVMRDFVIDGHGLRGGLRALLSLTVPDQSGAVLIDAAALQERYEQYWLRSVDGSEIRVVLLNDDESHGTNREPVARVVSPDVHPGDRFLVQPR